MLLLWSSLCSLHTEPKIRKIRNFSRYLNTCLCQQHDLLRGLSSFKSDLHVKPPLLAHNVLAGDTWLDLLVGLGSSYACPSPSCWQPMLVSVIALHWIIKTYTCLSFSSKDGGQWERAYQMLFLLTHLLPPMSLVPCLLLPLYLWEKQVNGKHIYIALLFASEAYFLTDVNCAVRSCGI